MNLKGSRITIYYGQQPLVHEVICMSEPHEALTTRVQALVDGLNTSEPTDGLAFLRLEDVYTGKVMFVAIEGLFAIEIEPMTLAGLEDEEDTHE